MKSPFPKPRPKSAKTKSEMISFRVTHGLKEQVKQLKAEGYDIGEWMLRILEHGLNEFKKDKEHRR
jgi:hypothetical protein